MAENTYSEKLRDPRWQKKRLAILNRDKFKCRLCKDDETELHVHHTYYTSDTDPWEYEDQSLITLCSHCHKEVEKLTKTLKDEDEDFYITEMSVVKSGGWTGGGRLYFYQYLDKVVMRIYNSSNEYMCGYNLTEDVIKGILKLERKRSKYKRG